MIDDEVWLESERRGWTVPRHDPVVRERVCRLLLGDGARRRVADSEWVFMELVADDTATGGPRFEMARQDLDAA